MLDSEWVALRVLAYLSARGLGFLLCINAAELNPPNKLSPQSM
jgi:hypothetical protein